MEQDKPHNFQKNTSNSPMRRMNVGGNRLLENNIGKLPPQSLDLEEAVLGALMIEKDALSAVIDILKVDSFYKEANQRIYSAIITLFTNSEPIDLLTVTQQLKQEGSFEIVGAGYITQLTSKINSAANIEYHARIISQNSMKREMISVASGILRDAFEDTSDVFELLDRTENDLFKISDSNIRKNYMDMSSLMNQALKELEQKRDQKDGLTGVPSGFSSLDRITAGWQPTELIILAARPGMGKCLGKGTKVLMYDGSLRKVEDVKTGDWLMGDDSTPRSVKSIARGREKMYWIRQKNGIDYRVNESHILSLKQSNTPQADVLNIEVRDYLQKSADFKANHKGYKVAVDFINKALVADPYFVGLWLSGGADSGLSTHHTQVVDGPQQYSQKDKFLIKEYPQNTTTKKHQVFENKHIPTQYLINSKTNRLALLAGLIDGGERLAESLSGYKITQKSLELARQVKFLCDSLGYRTSLCTQKKSDFDSETYQISIDGDVSEIPVRVAHKKPNQWPLSNNKNWRMSDITVEYDKIDDYYGFEIDGNRLFLLEDMTVTHNTAFVVSSLRNAAVDFNMPVAIFSLEMSSVQLVNRLISAEAELDSEKLRKGSLLPHEWQQMHSRIDKLTNAPIYIDDTPALSILELRAKCRRLKQQHDIQMIVIDYLQLMTGDSSKGNGNREQEIGSISRSLKNLAKELHVPVIALSQLNRSVETRGGEKRPQLSDLRESGSIEQDADMVAFLYRPEYYGITQDEAGNSVQGIGELIIAKNRAGSLETIQLRFIGKYTKFADLDSYYTPTPGNFTALPPNTNFSEANSRTENTPSSSPGTFKSRANDLGAMPFPAPNPTDETPF
jgi:replicative DNA helicase